MWRGRLTDLYENDRSCLGSKAAEHTYILAKSAHRRRNGKGRKFEPSISRFKVIQCKIRVMLVIGTHGFHRRLIQPLIVARINRLRDVCPKNGLFRRSIERGEWENRTVLNCYNNIFWKVYIHILHYTLFVTKYLTVSSLRAKTWRWGRKHYRF